jgi:hypothetical protein
MKLNKIQEKNPSTDFSGLSERFLKSGKNPDSFLKENECNPDEQDFLNTVYVEVKVVALTSNPDIFDNK